MSLGDGGDICFRSEVLPAAGGSRATVGDGSLRGFAWGLDLKRRLLAHESTALPVRRFAMRLASGTPVP